MKFVISAQSHVAPCLARQGLTLAPFTAPARRISQRYTVIRTRSQEEGQEASVSEQTTETKTSPVDVEEPVWVRRERERELIEKEGKDLPFGVYLLASAIVAIAATGSIFEWTSKNPIFDIIESDSPLYTPILGLFAITGFPTSAYLFFKSVSAANKEAERMDKLDGY